MGDLGAFRKGRKILLVLPAITLVFAVGFAAVGLAAEAKGPDRLPELIKLVGLDVAFDHMGDGIKAGAKQLALRKGSENTDYWGKVLTGLDPAADRAFAPDALRREFLFAMDGRLSKADFDTIFAFYKSPLGARMTALENARITAGAEAPMGKAGELLEELKNKPERGEVLKLMESSLQLTESSTDRAFNMARAVAIGMAAADEKTTALPADAIQAIDSAMQQMRPAMMAQVKERVWLSLAYTYRDASVSELRQYLAFLTSSGGKKLYGSIVPAMNKVLIKAGGEFGHALMRELGKENI